LLILPITRRTDIQIGLYATTGADNFPIGSLNLQNFNVQWSKCLRREVKYFLNPLYTQWEGTLY